MSKVSVIIPTYNRASYVREAIDSVLNQTYKDIEIILVDDGSTDGTREVVQPYIDKRKIQYFYQENLGPSATRNAGLKLATGRYIKFLDSDDFLYPEQIERQVADTKEEPDAVSISDFCVLKPNGTMTNMEIYLVKRELQFASFVESNRGVIHAFLTPKHLIDRVGGFDETLSNCEDLDLWIRILQEGAYMKHLSFVGCCYRILNASLSADIDDMFIQKCKVYEKVNRSLLEYPTMNPYLVDRVLKINTELLDECMVRKIDLDEKLFFTARMAAKIYDSKKRGIFKLLFKSLGLKNYLQIRYFLKRLRQKNYAFEILHKDYRWKYQ